MKTTALHSALILCVCLSVNIRASEDDVYEKVSIVGPVQALPLKREFKTTYFAHAFHKIAGTADIPKIEIVEFPDDAPEVKKLVDFVNLVIEKYNADELEKVKLLLQEEWSNIGEINQSEQNNDFKINRISFSYKHDKETGKNTLGSIIFPTLWMGEINSTKPAGPFFGINFEDDKFDFAGWNYPYNDEVAYFIRKTNFGMQFGGVLLDDESNKGVPWVIWRENGKIYETKIKKLHGRDFSIDAWPDLTLSSEPGRSFFWNPKAPVDKKYILGKRPIDDKN